MEENKPTPMRVRWAQLRFSIIGPLLASPPEAGELQEQLQDLAKKTYLHPTSRLPVQFGASTIERWFYQAKDAHDPVAALARKVPSHAGRQWKISTRISEVIHAQYQEHPGWSFQLHYDNLQTLLKDEPPAAGFPSYVTVRRFMRSHALLRKRKQRDSSKASSGRETRSYEMSHVHALWHLDFHAGSRKVLTQGGEWKTPMLLGVLDDYSRLCCHLQWYLDETAETLIHGLCQAIQKRGLPRALMTDNGSAMVAAETVEGLGRLGISHDTTLPYSPEQNGKQEKFWGQVEGRLLAMLEGEPELSLALLNLATQAWVEREYQRKTHSELNEEPAQRALRGPSVVRASPSSEQLQRAFRTEIIRTQRQSDGTITVEGIRFEIPARYRTMKRLTLRVARWDLSSVDLYDARTGAHLCRVLPLDKQKNADGLRRTLAAVQEPGPAPPTGIAPRLRALMAEYAATGLPPAYLPKDDLPTKPEENP